MSDYYGCFKSSMVKKINTTSRRLADRKVERFEKNIKKRGTVPETTTKKGNSYPVGPVVLGFFIFVVIGSSSPFSFIASFVSNNPNRNKWRHGLSNALSYWQGPQSENTLTSPMKTADCQNRTVLVSAERGRDTVSKNEGWNFASGFNLYYARDVTKINSIYGCSQFRRYVRTSSS
ncbi:unnamed protein product [Ilex paraguariensis]|uniref:Uncharacterized protein n=1 Tax=Ilex paraguariensis TaxID=185542 RepID=A0ABC8UQ49_9AQUA